MNRYLTYHLIATSLLLTFLCTSCQNDIQTINNLSKKKVQVEEGKNINTLYTQGGKLKSNLKAPLMLRYIIDSPYVEFPKGIHVDMYKDSVTIETVVVARYCKYLESQSKVYMRDSVVITNMTGDTVWCQDMWWDQQKQIFYSNKPTRSYNKLGNQRLRGSDGFIAPQSLNSWTLLTTTGTMDFPKAMQ